MSHERGLLQYFASLGSGKVILWCYVIWYLVTVVNYFDPSPSIWLNSLGISAVVGFALLLSVSGDSIKNVDRWQRFRLFFMPFCVSSFSSLIKGHGYFLIMPPRASEQIAAVGLCTAFVLFIVILKHFRCEPRD